MARARRRGRGVGPAPPARRPSARTRSAGGERPGTQDCTQGCGHHGRIRSMRTPSRQHTPRCWRPAGRRHRIVTVALEGPVLEVDDATVCRRRCTAGAWLDFLNETPLATYLARAHLFFQDLMQAIVVVKG